jgi:hypothetical protein
VLLVYRYEGLEPLLATLSQKVVSPVEVKVEASEERRRMIEAQGIAAVLNHNRQPARWSGSRQRF